MKRLFLILIAIFCFSSSAHANEELGLHYADGWFDRNPGKFTAPPKLVDNDLSTKIETNNFEITFAEELEIKFVAFYAACYNSNGSYNINFFDASGNVVQSFNCLKIETNPSNLNSDEYVRLSVNSKIKKIHFARNGYSNAIKEFEVFDEVSAEKVQNLKVAEKSYSTIKVTYELPTNAVSAKLFLNNVYVDTISANKNSYEFNKLKSNTEYKIAATAVYERTESDVVEIITTTETLPAPAVEIAQESATINSAKIAFDVKSDYIKKVYVYDMDKKQKNVLMVYRPSSVYAQLFNLQMQTDYNYFARYEYGNGELTDYIPFAFRTAEPSKEVADLRAKATFENVNLDWKMPKYNTLDHAKIYRKEKSNVMLFSLFTADNFTPLFETNGTNFKDLTVAADTSYTYKVTTVDVDNNETNGKTVDVKTPKISVVGGGTTIDENGNYVITWEKPTSGQVKVLIANTEYKIVSAADKKIVIPAADMKLNFIGQPDVKLIPIDENGGEGISSSPGGGGGGIGSIVGGADVNEVLNAPNALKAAVQLIGVVGGFVLLSLAFLVVPKLTRTIRTAYNARKEPAEIHNGRRSS